MAENNPQTSQTEFPPKVLEYLRVIADKFSAKGFEDEETKMEREISQEMREIRKRQDKYGRLSYVTARSWKDLGNRIGNNLRLALTQSYVKNKYGWSNEKSARFAQRWIANGNKGLGVILTKIVPAVGMIVTVLESILKMLSERGRYLKSTTMYYPGLQNIGQLFTAATRHAAMVNSPLNTGIFAGSQEFKSAYRSILEAGLFFKGAEFKSGFTIFGDVDSTMSQLLSSFKKLAEEGIILGNSFQETANIMASVGSQYYMGRGPEALESYRFINSALQYAMASNFTTSNMTSWLNAYNKNVAYTSNAGFPTALREILIILRSINSNEEGILDNTNPQILAAQLQSLSSMNVSLSQFIALTQGLRSFGKSDLSDLAESYRTTGQFERLADMWNTLESATGLDIKTLMAVAPGYFGGLQGKSGQLLADIIKNHADTLSGKEFEGLTTAQSLQKLTTEYNLRGLSDTEANEAKFYAQQQVLFEQPLQTIIALLTSAVQSLIQMAGTFGIFGKKLPAYEIIRDSMNQIQDVNSNKSASTNTWGSRY